MIHHTISSITIVVVLIWTWFCTETNKQIVQAPDDVEEHERKWGFNVRALEMTGSWAANNTVVGISRHIYVRTSATCQMRDPAT